MFYFTLLLLSQFIEPFKCSPIVGGYVVQNNGVIKYPFMVSLQLKAMKQSNINEYNYEHFCGGSLLSHKWILSAGHCLWNKNISNVFAVIGHDNIEKIIQKQRVAVEHVEYFLFEPTSLRNDIALLRLKEAYNDSNGLHLGKLPKYGMKANRKDACKIIGFGATKHAGVMQQQLNEAEVFVITNKRCRILFGHVWAPQKGDNTVCAMGNSQDTCQGDSGGPLLCPYNGKLYIYGIASYGLTCGLRGMPSVYTISGPYNEWIEFITSKSDD